MLLNELEPGMRLHGGVVGVTDFAAFLDVHVVRKGSGGRVSDHAGGMCVAALSRVVPNRA